MHAGASFSIKAVPLAAGEARSLLKELSAPLYFRGIAYGRWTDTDVAVQDAVIEAESRRDEEVLCRELGQQSPQVLLHERVKRRHRFGVREAVEERKTSDLVISPGPVEP